MRCCRNFPHPQRRIASIIATAHAPPKTATNRNSPCANASPQPPACKQGKPDQLPQDWIFHLTLVLKRPDPPLSSGLVTTQRVWRVMTDPTLTKNLRTPATGEANRPHPVPDCWRGREG